MFIVLRPCDGFPDMSSVALTFVLFVWRCLPIGVSVLTLSLKSGEGMRILFQCKSRIADLTFVHLRRHFGGLIGHTGFPLYKRI